MCELVGQIKDSILSMRDATMKIRVMASCIIFVHEMYSYSHVTTTTLCTALCIVFNRFNIYIANLSLHIYNTTIIVCFFVEYLPGGGRKRLKHVAGLQNVCIIIISTYGVAGPSARAV